jgi:hypothetical protein
MQEACRRGGKPCDDLGPGSIGHVGFRVCYSGCGRMFGRLTEPPGTPLGGSTRRPCSTGRRLR